MSDGVEALEPVQADANGEESLGNEDNARSPAAVGAKGNNDELPPLELNPELDALKERVKDLEEANNDLKAQIAAAFDDVEAERSNTKRESQKLTTLQKELQANVALHSTTKHKLSMAEGKLKSAVQELQGTKAQLGECEEMMMDLMGRKSEDEFRRVEKERNTARAGLQQANTTIQQLKLSVERLEHEANDSRAQLGAVQAAQQHQEQQQQQEEQAAGVVEAEQLWLPSRSQPCRAHVLGYARGVARTVSDIADLAARHTPPPSAPPPPNTRRTTTPSLTHSGLTSTLAALTDTLLGLMDAVAHEPKPNLMAVGECVVELRRIVDGLFVQTQRWVEGGLGVDQAFGVDVWCARLRAFMLVLPRAVHAPFDDPVRWEATRRAGYEVRDYSFTERDAREYERLLSYVDLAFAFGVDSVHIQSPRARALTAFGAKAPYYLARSAKSRQRAEWAHAVVDIALAKFVWNLPTHGLVARSLKASLPSIATERVFEVPCAHTMHPLEDGASPVMVPVRLLCAHSLSKRKSEGFVLHLHGGGFVAMNTFCHQTYTRDWAKQTGMPILSVDYRKAPEHPFPCALDDCFSVYLWALQHAEEQLGIRPKKVVVVGDSAGGNLAAALVVRCITERCRVPDGLVLAYPALLIDYHYTPSFRFSLSDRLLPFSFLALCSDCYAPPGQVDRTHPFVSPQLAPDDVLAKFPRTRLVVGNRDPLHDDSVKFAQRLFDTTPHKDVELRVYEGVAHGFLNLYRGSLGVQAFRHASARVATYLAHLLA